MTNVVHQICILDDYSSFKAPPTVDVLKNTIPGAYTLWKEEEIKALIEKNFSPRVLEAYNLLKANALKADLARYCILYVHGGWYVDLLTTVDGTVEPHNLNNYDMLVFRDLPLLDKSTLPVSNSILWFKDKKNFILKDVIETCTQNILDKIYPKNSHRISGPAVLGASIAKACIASSKIDILVGDLLLDNDTGHLRFSVPNWEHRKNVHFAWYKLPGLENNLPDSYQKNSLYANLYKTRDLYHA